MARRRIIIERPPVEALTKSFEPVGFPDCKVCRGDGWERGYGPGPCRACALRADRINVPY
jgi:hypothetical protein